MKLLKGLEGLGNSSWELRALHKTCSRDEHRLHIQGIHMHAESRYAVATNGHALFAERSLYQPGIAGKTVERAEWLEEGRIVAVDNSNYPDWTQVIPKKPTLVTKWEVPADLPVFCRVLKDVRILFEEGGDVTLGRAQVMDQFVRSRLDQPGEPERKLRRMNADLISCLAGQKVSVLWERDSAISPVLFVPLFFEGVKDGDCTREQMLHGEWPWFLICMPMRTFS